MALDLVLDGFSPRAPAAEDRLPAPFVLAQALQDAVSGQSHRGDTGLGMAGTASVLWSRFLRFDSSDPHWPDRDRFVVSAARFAPLLRGLLSLTADGEPPVEDSAGAGHGLFGFGQHPGVEMAIGPAGQGIATATGMAMAERILAARFGHSLVEHRTWVMACETDLAAGVALEAASLAGQMRLERLTVLFELDSGGAAGCESQVPGEAPFGPMARFAACGWSVRRVNANDPEAIAQAIQGATRGRKPSLIACMTARPGSGQPASGEARAGDASGSAAEVAAGRAAWHAVGSRGNAARRAWLKRLARHRLGPEFQRVASGRLPVGWHTLWRDAWNESGAGEPTQALDALGRLLPEFVSLSCEPGLPSMPQLGRVERALGLGTQEHGMAALLNGVALHGGLLACGCASFIGVDRMRPALRLAALMGRHVIHLLTHDGLALGEDGAAWQPVEQLASLRAMPNVAVFRPADGNEAMECWQLALHRTEGPSLIACSTVPPDIRAEVLREPQARSAAPWGIGNACARGGYVLAEAPVGRDHSGGRPGGRPASRDVTLIATGPEVGIALEARALLLETEIRAAVVSLPCWELFSTQSPVYRETILGSAPRVGIEAASGFGWERWLGPHGLFIGIDDFGVSLPADALYRRFGITPDAIAARVRRRFGIRDLVSRSRSAIV